MIPGLETVTFPYDLSDAFATFQGKNYADLYESGRMAARLVDKIFKGRSPAKIPVEVNQKVEFVINLKTARAMDIELRPEILYQATRLLR